MICQMLKFGLTPFMIAAREGHLEVVQHLCASCHVERDATCTVMNLSASPHPGTIEQSRFIAQVEDKEYSAIGLSAKGNKADVVRYLASTQPLSSRQVAKIRSYSTTKQCQVCKTRISSWSKLT